MVKVKEDMTGWRMWEHGVPDSRLTVICQTDDHVNSNNGRRSAKWLCECNCAEHNQISVRGADLKNGTTKSCGCLSKELLLKRNKKENKRDLSGQYGIIWSTNTNEEIYFDLEDADKIIKYAWFIGGNGYPMTNINNKTIKMHIFLGFKWHDHHNQNKLDNRKINLWPCTQEENNRNVPKAKNNTSGFIGVHYEKRRGKYVASICVSRKRIHIGYYTNLNDAVIARLKAEAEYFGEFAPQRHLFEQYQINIKDGDIK
jgi:hypothetical protein